MDLRAGEVLINETATACHTEKQIKKNNNRERKNEGCGEKVAFGAEKAMLDEGLKGLRERPSFCNGLFHYSLGTTCISSALALDCAPLIVCEYGN